MEKRVVQYGVVITFCLIGGKIRYKKQVNAIRRKGFRNEISQ